MKAKLNLAIILVLTLLLNSCKSTEVTELSKRQLANLDKSLIGTWVGSETGVQFKDAKREWVMVRKEDGTYIITFKTQFPDFTSEDTEEGIWWTKNGLFYEQHTGYPADVYEYTVLNKNEIKFKAKKIRATADSEEYEFIDTRIEN